MATEASIAVRSWTVFTPSGQYWTDEELMALPELPGQRYELRDGEVVVMSPAGADHTHIEVRLVIALGVFVEERRLGQVCSGQAGFRLSPLLCYSPDVGFVSKARLRRLLPDPEKFVQGAPDLAVEVLSPGDSLRQTERKIVDYFRHGSVAAWLVIPRH